MNAPTKTPSKTERYISRLQDHLWWMHSDAERFDFITHEMARFEELRDAFIRKVDQGGDPGTTTIWDFTDTLQALEIEQAKYSPNKRIDATALNASVGHLTETLETM